jgi:hypothetical protein
LVQDYSTLFPGSKIYRIVSINENKTSEQQNDDILHVESSDKVVIVDHANQTIWEITSNTVQITFVDDYAEKDTNNFKAIVDKIPLKQKESSKRAIQLVASDNGYFYTIQSDIKDTTINLVENYNDGFEKVHEDILKFVEEKGTGLALLYGTRGSGKSSYLRHIISNTNKKYLLVTNAIAAHLAEPDFISFLLSQRDSIFILEDCEQILAERENNIFGGAIANILNMSDGLLSDIFNIKFICTFNTNIDKIDKALLRKGRCKINYEFKELAADKVEKLAKKLKINISEYKAMTLADIYNFSEEVKEKKTKKIGFY